MTETNRLIDDGISKLIDMGFTKEKAEEAFQNTGYQSVELAASYLLSNDVFTKSSDSSEDDWEDIENNYKMVFVVNSDLNMSIGKTAAQVAHGCLGLYKELESQSCIEGLRTWTEEGQKKIVLKGKNAEELAELCSQAKNLGVPAHIIQDAGRTEIACGSITVLALFGLEEDVNKITGSLRLLK